MCWRATQSAAEVADLWLQEQVYQQMLEESLRAYPLETGGMLVGYFLVAGAVVTYYIGPGSNASHERHTFTPDTEFQVGILDDLYKRTNGKATYLGEWHTHPDGRTRLSGLDVRTLRSISRDSGARAPYPAMLILAGGPEGWIPGGVQWCDSKIYLNPFRAKTSPLNLRVFDYAYDTLS